MIKKFFSMYVICGLMLLVGLCGCMKNSISVDDYLFTKYNKNFNVAEGTSQSWSTSYKIYNASDDLGNSFSIRCNKNDENYEDNYSSFIYDKDILYEIQNIFDSKYKIDVSTKNSFFGIDIEFSNILAYMSKCDYVDLVIYTDNHYDKDDISNKLIHNFSGVDFAVAVKVMKDDIYNNDINNIHSKDIISTTVFSIKDGIVVESDE